MERLAGTPYLVGEPLGRGPHGVVLAGRDAAGRRLAIKVLAPALSPIPATYVRFERWRNAALALRHEHVVAGHDLVLTGDSLAIVSDRVDGGDLRQALVVCRSIS